MLYAPHENEAFFNRLLDVGFVFFALLVLFLLLGLRLMLRKEWLAFAAVVALWAGIAVFRASVDESVTTTVIRVVFDTLDWCIIVLLPLRFGFLSLVFFFMFDDMIRLPAECGLSGWPSGASWTAMLFLTAVTVYGFRTALAGRPLFRDELLQA